MSFPVSLSLLDRIKKEMSEGIVRALLEDAGYYVIDTGIEKVVREVSGYSKERYLKLAFPPALRRLPDLIVMSRDEATKYLVEVKYRETWDASIFENIKEQVAHMEEIVLVFINANPPKNKEKFKSYPSRYLRSCKVRHINGKLEVEIKKYNSDKTMFVELAALPCGDALWWSMLRLQSQFPQMQDKTSENNLIKAVKAIAGILH